MNSRERARKKGKKKVTPLHVVVAAVLALGISALVILYTDSFGFASVLRGFFTASESEFVDPDGMQMVNGDFTVNDAGTTLENKHITGNLYLGPGIGDGSLKLFNVVVEGSVLVQGGGLNSIYLTDSTIGIVRVNRPEGRIKLVVAGKTVVGQTFLETGALLVEELAADFVGFDEVEVLTAEKTELNGSFSAVLILVEGAEVHISSEELALLTITGTAIGARVHIAENVVIDKLTIDAPAYLLGQGEFGLTTVSAAGITGLAGSFRQVRVSSEAGHLDLGEGTVQQLVVERSALKNSISVAKEAAVTDLELNEAVEVSGAGAVQKILINAPGSTIAQIPFEIEFGQDVSVLIGGHVISNPAMLHAL
ncbi:MAG TPA: hypothetical protein VLH18_05820, partial [Candidatus Limnocylindrales bacterium]|nr:hypothetical protein [Candidatus Limnocylindrales bacterium]